VDFEPLTTAGSWQPPRMRAWPMSPTMSRRINNRGMSLPDNAAPGRSHAKLRPRPIAHRSGLLPLPKIAQGNSCTLPAGDFAARPWPPGMEWRKRWKPADDAAQLIPQSPYDRAERHPGKTLFVYMSNASSTRSSFFIGFLFVPRPLLERGAHVNPVPVHAIPMLPPAGDARPPVELVSSKNP